MSCPNIKSQAPVIFVIRNIAGSLVLSSLEEIRGRSRSKFSTSYGPPKRNGALVAGLIGVEYAPQDYRLFQLSEESYQPQLHGTPGDTAQIYLCTYRRTGDGRFNLAPGIAHGLYLTIVLITALPGNVDCNRENWSGRIPSEVDREVKLAGLRIP